ncbi:DUF7210 family protein [Rhodocyclus tenuis]|uniref:DUF7210 domain-containing protein n=1 Tax=Rhodocyclus tenuis TaxID=1066 RepID=A0A840FYQ1_RHOTE|nr:hypothetical protein [Rhodocyclus tenuis]MBB4247247.1 hypothetical protein [Rhodocyclus tenuis]
MNTKTAIAAAEAVPEGFKKIVLTLPHTDSGTEHPVGAELTLPAPVADWLVSIQSADVK